MPFFEKFFTLDFVSKKSTHDNFLLSQNPLFEVDPPKIQISESLDFILFLLKLALSLIFVTNISLFLKLWVVMLIFLLKP